MGVCYMLYYEYILACICTYMKSAVQCSQGGIQDLGGGGGGGQIELPKILGEGNTIRECEWAERRVLVTMLCVGEVCITARIWGMVPKKNNCFLCQIRWYLMPF